MKASMLEPLNVQEFNIVSCEREEILLVVSLEEGRNSLEFYFIIDAFLFP